MTDFRPDVALEVLVRHGVRFVVIGGMAANARGAPLITGDLDICYARDDQNLVRLAAALHDLDAVLGGAPEDVPFQLDGRTLRAGDCFTFETSAGAVDILGTPAGAPGGFDELVRNSDELEVVEGCRVMVCALDDLIRMKTAAGRPKDRSQVEVLGALRDEIEGQPDG